MQAVEELRRIGYEVSIKGEGSAAKIACRYIGRQQPDPTIVTPLLNKLKECKGEAIAYLRPCEPLPLSEADKVKKALRERGIAAIQSDALDGEVIYFARDKKAAQRAPGGAVVYTLEELRAIVQCPPSEDGLKRIHVAKKLFNGQVMNCD